MQRRKINMLTRMKYIGMLACLMGGIFLFCTFYYKSQNVSVKDGIKREDAIEKITKDEGYFDAYDLEHEDYKIQSQ